MPTNSLVRALLTDMYEITMASAYFKSGKHDDTAAFDLFFRKNPFDGEFTVFAGLSEVVDFVKNFHFSDEDIDFVCNSALKCDTAFRNWLKNIDTSEVKIFALKEGSICFPRLPVIRVEGPLGICQLLESALLNLVSFPSLIATNAARMRLAAGKGKSLIEFGLRRAQGPDGAVSASRYSYLGGFDGTSNMLAGKLFDIPVSGTQAHAYIQSFSGLDEIADIELVDSNGEKQDLTKTVLDYRSRITNGNSNDGELASFISYAAAFPDGFLALVDTYDTLNSGIPNFLCVALALKKFGYEPIGIRLDSGDLSHLSRSVRNKFNETAEKFKVDFSDLKIVASNEINESTLSSLERQGHEIDIFGIGTHLVTCQAQPSLGCVYKLVEVNNEPRIKLSQEASKVTIPGRKKCYRLTGREGYPLADVMLMHDENPPEIGKRFLCCHPFEKVKRTFVIPSDVIPLHHQYWDGDRAETLPSLEESREYARTQLDSTRPDHLRFTNPTPYKVSLSEKMFNFMHELWSKEIPPGELE